MNSISFDNRVVIVTGAGGGLGRGYALDIARRGGSVVVNDLGGSVEGPGASREMADLVVAEIRAAGGRAVASYDNVATVDGARRIASCAIDNFGHIDALINNAGNLRSAWFEDASAQDLDAHVQVHLNGAFNVTQAVWPHMKARNYGRVVFTSSSAGMLGNDGQSAYGAAKGGVTGLMNVLAQEGEPCGILCNGLLPHATSRMGSKHAEMMGLEPTRDAAATPAWLIGARDPSFVTGIAVYLASDACTTTHSLYRALAGRISRVFIGVSRGWQGSREHPATAEDVAAHIAQIRDTTHGSYIPDSLQDDYQIAIAPVTA